MSENREKLIQVYTKRNNIHKIDNTCDGFKVKNVTGVNKTVIMKAIFKILAAFCFILMLSSCGAVRKTGREPQKETEVQKDTLSTTHPPVIVPHTWRDA